MSVSKRSPWGILAPMPSGDPSERLDSWKAIAEYLGRDVRTVMRWAKTGGLPVHRIGQGRRRAVFAYAGEIDQWLAQGRAAPADSAAGRKSSTKVWALTGGMVLLAVAAFVVWLTRPSPSVGRVAVTDRDVVAFDEAGRDLWRYRLAGEQESLAATKVSLVGWGRERPLEVVVPASVNRAGGDGTGALLLLSESGQLRWRRALDQRLVYGSSDYGPAWLPDAAVTYQVDGQWRIAAAFHHHTWWPSIVAVFDRDGNALSAFINQGWLRRLNLTRDGRHLLAAGTSNAFGGAALAILDARDSHGASPQEGSRLPACANCPRGAPVAYVVAPWSDLARSSDTPPVHVEVADSGEIQLRAAQRLPRDGVVPEIIVNLAPDFSVQRVEVSDGFKQLHAALERTGELSHSLERCVLPSVRVWTTGSGWRGAGNN
jgi:hypothetical protein